MSDKHVTDLFFCFHPWNGRSRAESFLARVSALFFRSFFPISFGRGCSVRLLVYNDGERGGVQGGGVQGYGRQQALEIREVTAVPISFQVRPPCRFGL